MSFAGSSALVLFPHGSDLAEVVRASLSRLRAALFAERSGGIHGKKIVGQVDGCGQQLIGALGSALRQGGRSENVLRF